MMKRNKVKTGIAIAALTMAAPQVMVAAEAGAGNPLNLTKPAQKKLLEFGWDQYFLKNPAYIRDNIREMEKRPFDGIIFRLADGGGEIFDITQWDEAKLAPQLKIVSDIKWSRFTDNFVYLMSASKMDWTSDADWAKVTAHTRFCARAARLAKCKGLVFDPESYGFDPWVYSNQKHAATISFNDYQKLVRRRGAQFMRTIQREMPNAVIPMFHLFQAPYGATGMADSSKVVDPEKRNESLKGNLYMAFLNGMLDAMGPGITLIDGNEQSYYYSNSEQYYRAYHAMRQGVKIFVAAENQAKFDRQVRAGQALYVDHVFNTRPPISRSGPGIQMTPEERAKWFEHNVFYALDASDGYAWLYSESMNWWKNENLPPGLEAATIGARQKIAEGKTLGFDFNALLRNVEERSKAQIAAGLIRRTASPAKITPAQAPKIDGLLDDELYKNLKTEPPFVGYFSLAKAGDLAFTAGTQTTLSYDEQKLYIAFRCEEPDTRDLKNVGAKRDDNVWAGDAIEVSVSQPMDSKATAMTPESTYFHFIINPAGQIWDSKAQGSTNDLAYDGNIECATHVGVNEWTAEIAIPWSEMQMPAPQTGTRLFANLARHRVAAGDSEGTSWSQFVGSFLEPENFGEWRF